MRTLKEEGIWARRWVEELELAILDGIEGFEDDLIGVEGFVMPATQHDAVLWISGSAYDVVFDVAREAMAELHPLASVADETSSWPYRHDRDLRGSSMAPRTPA